MTEGKPRRGTRDRPFQKWGLWLQTEACQPRGSTRPTDCRDADGNPRTNHGSDLDTRGGRHPPGIRGEETVGRLDRLRVDEGAHDGSVAEPIDVYETQEPALRGRECLHRTASRQKVLVGVDT